MFVTDYTDVRDLGDRILAIGTIRIRGKAAASRPTSPSALVLAVVGLSEQEAAP